MKQDTSPLLRRHFASSSLPVTNGECGVDDVMYEAFVILSCYLVLLSCLGVVLARLLGVHKEGFTTPSIARSCGRSAQGWSQKTRCRSRLLRTHPHCIPLSGESPHMPAAETPHFGPKLRVGPFASHFLAQGGEMQHRLWRGACGIR